jgi:hypothetical protein
MTTLLPYAEELVKDPPVDVFNLVMKDYAVQSGDADAKDMFANNVKEVGETAATYTVAAICDLTAMCMMMIAAGVTRIEAMKTAIKNAGKNVTGTVFEDKNYGDHVFYYRQQADARDFENRLADWSMRAGSGVVQFKFAAKNDFHTFAIERVQEKNYQPAFLVYQSYQNTYRLGDFLGQRDPKEVAAQMKMVWSNFKKLGDKAGYKDENDFVTKILDRIDKMKECVGSESPLDVVALAKYVIKPLSLLLGERLPRDQYSLLTASYPASRMVGTNLMTVLMCDTVSPADFSANYKALRSSPKNLTLYPAPS